MERSRTAPRRNPRTASGKPTRNKCSGQLAVWRGAIVTGALALVALAIAAVAARADGARVAIMTYAGDLGVSDDDGETWAFIARCAHDTSDTRAEAAALRS